MSMDSRCQVCGQSFFSWTVRQAEIHVGKMQHYKIQACEMCTKTLETAVAETLERLRGK